MRSPMSVTCFEAPLSRSQETQRKRGATPQADCVHVGPILFCRALFHTIELHGKSVCLFVAYASIGPKPLRFVDAVSVKRTQTTK